MTSAIASATASFRRTLRKLGPEIEEQALDDPAQFGRRAALLAAAEVLWNRQLGGWLDVQEVQALLGVTTRQAVHDLVKRGKLLGLPMRNGRIVFPRPQFGPDGRPYPAIAGIVAAF